MIKVIGLKKWIVMRFTIW